MAQEQKVVSTPKVDIEVHSQHSDMKHRSIWEIWALLCKGSVACAPSQLSSEYKSVNVMQLPGYGKSAIKADVNSLTLDDYLAALDQVIQSDDAVLYGYSHSGYFMAQYALKNPSKVRALVLVEPALFTSKDELLNRAKLISEGKDQQAMSSMLKYVGSHDGAQLGQIADELLSNVNSSSAVAQEYRIRAENEVTEEALAQLNIPVLLVAGTNSKANFMVKRAFQALPNAFVSWVYGASHLDLEKSEYEAEVAAAINSFLLALGANDTKIFDKMMASLHSAADSVRESQAELAA